MILTKEPYTEITEGHYPQSDTCVLIRFDFSSNTFHGEFRHLYMDTVYSFQTVSELIFRLELLLEQINQPASNFLTQKEWDPPSRSGNRLKSDHDTPDPAPALLDEPSFQGINKSGDLFLLHIRYRRNASWQGALRWVNKKQNFNFRSTLEVLMILEALYLEARG